MSFVRVQVVVLALTLLVVAAPPGAQAQTACPQVMPSSQVTAGMTGVGYTVSKGTTPESFSVEVLGVMKDGVAPGRDMIIVDVSGAAIDRAGGIWFGMSGSPVYVGGKLIGAVAFGLSWGPSSIGGLTAAQDMMSLLEYGGTSASAQEADEVTLSGSVATEVRERETSSAGESQPRMVRLKTPLAVSGANARVLELVERAAERSGLSLLPFASSASAPTSAAQTTPQAGGNFAGAISYGDVTIAGVGTTTFVCDGRAVAFGHPFFFAGATTMGANAADAVTIIPDSLGGPYKLANITGSYGTLDQDRLAGIRATLGAAPAAAPITSSVRDADTGRSRQGRTDVVFQDAFPFLGAMHLLANLDTTIDRIGPGTLELDWTVTGHRESGATWQLSRGNRFASDWDIAFESIFELAEIVSQLDANPFEEVSLTNLQMTAAAAEEVRRYTISEVAVSVDGGPFDSSEEIMVTPGSELAIRVTLSARRLPDRLLTLSLSVPDDFFGGAGLVVSGGQWFGGGFAEPGFFPEEETGGNGAGSFDGLLEELGNRPRNDDLVARIVPDEGFGEEPESRPEPEAFAASADGHEVRRRLDRVVQGERLIRLWSDGGPGSATVERIAGRGRIDTAVAVSQRLHPGGAPAVVVGQANGYADALAGAPLAATVGGPMLLSSSHALDEVVAEEVRRLGATQAFVLGGEAALSAEVESGLRAAGVTDVVRFGGRDRFDTARLVAERIGGEEVYVALGAHPDPNRAWPDALAVSALAAQEHKPVLLVERDTVPAPTSQALAELGASTATVVGGTAAVSDGVADELRGLGLSVTRLSGSSRYDTSAAVARRAAESGADPSLTWIVTGKGYADALAAGPAAAASGGVLLLVDGASLDGSPAARAWLEELAGYGRAVLVGGTAAIGVGVEEEIATILGGGAFPE